MFKKKNISGLQMLQVCVISGFVSIGGIFTLSGVVGSDDLGRNAGVILAALLSLSLIAPVYISWLLPYPRFGSQLFFALLCALGMIFMVQDFVFEIMQVPGHCGSGFSAGNCYFADGLGALIYYIIFPILWLIHCALLIWHTKDKNNIRSKTKAEKKRIALSRVYAPYVALSLIFLFFTYCLVINNLGSKPPKQNAELRAKAERIKQSQERSLHSVSVKTTLINLTSSLDDVCFEKYTELIHKCGVVTVGYYGILGDFSATMRELDKALLDNGWSSSSWTGQTDIVYELEDYHTSKAQNIRTISDMNYEKNEVTLSIEVYPVPIQEQDDSFLYDQEVEGSTEYTDYEERRARSVEEVNHAALDAEAKFVVSMRVGQSYYES